MNELIQIDTITEFHRLNGIPLPDHPLISVINYADLHKVEGEFHYLKSFYSISLKKDVVGKYRYGQQSYDFDEGLMTFFAPKQVLRVQYTKDDIYRSPSGYILFVHPDFLWNTSLTEKIKTYEFFGYEVNEALFLSEKEEKIILEIFRQIQQEYSGNMDDFSKNIIISQIELLLNYSERFYKRQFLTRDQSNHEILTRFEKALDHYFMSDILVDKGLPTVQYLSDELHLSPDYLSSTLKHLTGQNARQHIQNKIIERAKEKLSNTGLSISEIAYELGFEYSQSFSKLFKQKTKQTPLEFRKSFNRN
ncbi:helix-turn-helix domain-containing protein [Sphingobacterium corticibacterium]|uniref:AraC family transcriptional regulator n=1 Tax=Sphingobacterium corticibacterium TaxID=2484746 RepID=A0A4Q6XRX8_9SPHI|nr:helix-turn-helix domain-containing protein [Sphingobacterium corticibacterium]RZF62515.1 AraC family transcriptional regulator [Sphingobacterium corticibacterium]